jgi:dTDP-4-dehydrorhamnose reductase
MMTNNDRPIVILGNGYIGRALSGLLESRSIPHKCVSRSTLDYHHPQSIRSIIALLQPKAVVMAFGFTGHPNVDACESNPEQAYRMNLSVPQMVAQECVRHNTHCIALSTGCIFDGYNKVYSVKDKPNNGIDSKTASVYCRTKHYFEEEVKSYPMSIVRVRMTYSGDVSVRNYLYKLLQYPNLLNTINSKTYLPQLLEFLILLSGSGMPSSCSIYHAVNPRPLTMPEILERYMSAGLYRSDWALVDRIQTIATRSNCVLNNEIPMGLNTFTDEEDCIDYAMSSLKNKLGSRFNLLP